MGATLMPSMSRRNFSLCFLLPLCVSLALAADPGIWKVTPPPPVSWERDRVADLTARRQALMQQIGDKGILILYAAEPRNYANDVDWPYRQENDFFYLTAIPQAGSALVMIPGNEGTREILFLPPPNPAQETWTGHILTAAEGRSISGIQEVWDARLLNSFLSTLIPPAEPIVKAAEAEAAAGRGGRGGRGGPPGAPPAILVDVRSAFRMPMENVAKGQAEIYMISRGRPAEYRREIDFAARLTAAGLTVKDVTPVFATLRRVKSQREIEILQHAVDITAEAFQRAYTLGVPGAWEYEIQAQFEFTFLRRNAHWGYPCIVAAGANATTLHYETNKDRMKAGDLLLMDDAAEFDGYSVDVTRTIPVSGKFSKEQAEIYRIVWEAQQAGLKKALPGHTWTGGADSVTGAANQVFKDGLLKLGLITDVKNDQQVRIWFNHGIGHNIGLNVHDGPAIRELQPGMMVTLEPGIYIRPDALENLPKTPENEQFIAAVRPAFEKYKGIGVRIEDDILVTAGAPKMLSGGIPSKLEDVEATIAQLRKAQKTTPLP
jgi:Xaa-Pro aminopeptidase